MISTLNIPIKISKKSVEQGSWPHNSYLVELASSNLKRERKKKMKKQKKYKKNKIHHFIIYFYPVYNVSLKLSIYLLTSQFEIIVSMFLMPLKLVVNEMKIRFNYKILFISCNENLSYT